MKRCEILSKLFDDWRNKINDIVINRDVFLCEKSSNLMDLYNDIMFDC